MAVLKLKSLMCLDTEDSTGPDEARLVVNGITRWRKRMNDGSTVSLKDVKPIQFEKRARIDLFDDDYPDPDDHLGTAYALVSDLDKGEIQHTFRYKDMWGGSAKYALTWTVK